LDADTHVTFVLHGADVQALARLDPDRDWREFVTGERAWVLQTYLRLRQAGLAAELSTRLPRRGIAVFSASHRAQLARGPVQRTDAFLLATRQDRRETLFADGEVVQNPAQANGSNLLHVPHWPQPGLMPRDAARGDSLRRVEYKGFVGNLHPDFHGPAWPRFLADHGIEWVCDGKVYARGATDGLQLQWNDFRETDLVLAVRPASTDLHLRKPATKLCNAWLAGVPALLGPESAYRSLRRDDRDFIEVSSRAEAEAAILGLLQEPARYARMRQRARERAADFTVERVVERWLRVLQVDVPALASQAVVRRQHRWPVFWRNAAGRLRRWSGGRS
jgi:hypothetical protein